jgi:adenylate cyclase
MCVRLDKDEITVGRDPTNDVVVEHPSVSRRHAKLLRRDGDWRVVDLGSRFGTRVNDLTHTDRVLRHGDTIYLHRFPLTFLDGGASSASLTGSAEHGDAAGPQTVFQRAVDFTSLATAPPDLDRLRRLLTVVTEASRGMLSSTSLDETFARVLDLIFEHLPVERGFVMLMDGPRQEFVTRCVRHREAAAGPIHFSRTIAERVVRERVAVMTTDALSDGRFAEGASIVALGIRSAMAAPLWSQERVEGLIYVDTTRVARAFDGSDLDLLSALGHHLAIAIAQARLQASILEQQLARRRLERYHSPAVVARITAGPGSGETLVAEERDVTVLFADVAAFTPRCEALEPRQVAELLNRYFTEMADAIFAHEGTLDKFIGDGLMAVFGAPFSVADHARRAVEAALDMREALRGLNELLPPASRLEFRVGLHSGRVIAGDIGSPRRTDYTVLGATVNLAARLESVAAPGQIVLSEPTRLAAGDDFQAEFIGEHQLKGLSRPIRCFALLGRTPAAPRT